MLTSQSHETRMTKVKQMMNTNSMARILRALGLVVFVLVVSRSSAAVAAIDDARLIRAEIMAQQNAWNAGDIDR